MTARSALSAAQRIVLARIATTPTLAARIHPATRAVLARRGYLRTTDGAPVSECSTVVLTDAGRAEAVLADCPACGQRGVSLHAIGGHVLCGDCCAEEEDEPRREASAEDDRLHEHTHRWGAR